MLGFEPITLNHREIIEDLVRRRGFTSAQLSFPSLFALEKYGNEICVKDGAVYLAQHGYDEEGRLGFQLPLVANDDVMPAALKEIEAYCEAKGALPRFCDVTEERWELLSSIYGDKVSRREKPEAHDYIYSRESLSTLSGGKLKAIRQSVTAFYRTMEGRISFEEMTPDNLSEVYRFQNRWLLRYAEEKAPGLDGENRFIAKCFENWETLKLSGGLLRIDGEIKAYTFGCGLTGDCYDILVEKADFKEDPALYRVINHSFASRLPEKWLSINRENDMGVPGVRTAKQRYQPLLLLKKYVADLYPANEK